MQCVIKCVAFPNVKISIGEEDTSELEKQIQYYFEKENLKKVMDFEREKLSLKEKELEKFEKSNNVKSLFVDNPELLEE